MNKHLKNQLDSNYCSLLPENIKKDLESEYEVMSSIGIDNDDDQNKFFMVLNLVPQIAKSIFDLVLSTKASLAVAAEIYKNKEKAPVDTFLNLIEAIDLALKKMMPFDIRPKIAYPQPNGRLELPRYDLTRWVSATHQIYSLIAKGYSEREAQNIVLDSWDKREKMDYDQWVRFYKEKTPEKYPKLASFDSELTLGGIPANSLKAMLPAPSGFGRNKIPPGLPQNLPHSTNDVSDARDRIESQRSKIISRLNSAEKMLASMDGQFFAGEDQELMLKLLQDLKRRIQIANKLTVKSSLFEDHIYRVANQLKFQGKDKAAGLFFKIAQLPPLGAPPGGMGLFSEPPPSGAEEKPTPSSGNKQDTEDLLREFFENLKRGVNDKDDSPEEREEIEKNGPPVSKPPSVETSAPAPAPVTAVSQPPTDPGAFSLSLPTTGPEPEGEKAAAASEYINLGIGIWKPITKEALVPPRQSAEQAGFKTEFSTSTPVETEHEDTPDDKTDDVIEAALSNIKIQDVIKRLEMLVSIYNQREISRQLAFLDIMMDRIGLAAFFPQLGEAMSKALESNQYIGNRLEEVLGKLKGSISVPGATEWVETPRQNNPETTGIINKLRQDEMQEEQRKEMRKKRDMEKMQNTTPATDGKVPEVEIREPVSRVEKQPAINTR